MMGRGRAMTCVMIFLLISPPHPFIHRGCSRRQPRLPSSRGSFTAKYVHSDLKTGRLFSIITIHCMLCLYIFVTYLNAILTFSFPFEFLSCLCSFPLSLSLSLSLSLFLSFFLSFSLSLSCCKLQLNS